MTSQIEPPVRPAESRISTSAIISDLVLWFMLTLLVVAVGVGSYLVWQGEKGQVIRLSFEDANELSRGSIVRMMGVDIGYVKDIQIQKDHVDITLKTSRHALKIPSGSRATILFTGLVGGKSLEIEPPHVPRPTVSGKPEYIVEDPIRLHEALQYQIDIANALKGGAEAFTDFFGKQKPVEELTYNIREGDEKIARIRTRVENANEKMTLSRHRFLNGLSEIRMTLSHFSETLEEAKALLGTDYSNSTIYAILRYTTYVFSEGSFQLETFQQTDGFERLNITIADTSNGLGRTYDRINTFSPAAKAARLETSLESLELQLTEVSAWPILNNAQSLEKVHHQIEKWRQQLETLNASF